MLRHRFSALLLFVFVLTSAAATAQFANPISWSFSSEHVAGDEFDLIATSRAEDGFSIYSQFTPEGGPIPTSFSWAAGDHYELVGNTEESGHLKQGMDELFGVEVHKFLSDEPVTWTQRVRVKDYGTPVELTVEWMCCDDEQCLPPTDEVNSFTLVPAGPARGSNDDDAQRTGQQPAETERRAPEEPGDDEPEATSDGTAPATPRAPQVAGAAATSPAPAGAVAAPATPSPPPAPAPRGDGLAVTGQAPSPQSVDAAGTGRRYAATGPAATEDSPVSWAVSATELTTGVYRLELTGSLSEGWTIYSKDVDPDAGPVPTSFVIESADGARAVGPVTETSATKVTKFDKVWEAVITKIDGGRVTYQQTVEVPAGTKISGFVEYQTCDDEMCFPPKEVPFTLDATGPAPVMTVDGRGAAAPPTAPAPPATGGTSAQLGIPVQFDPAPVGDCSEGAAETAGQGLWSIFGLGLLGGLFALIMPCIFPMIPLTVSFFTKSGGTRAEGIRKAGLYGFFIFLIYVLLSVPFHVLDGLDPGLLNNIASNVWLNLVFFAVFLFFAGSFFGFYELTLPESWSNRASQAEGTGGTVGIFFMALTLALVSFSCTGPILGSLLVEAVSGGAWPLTVGMAGFGVALGLPFALFAAFPGFLNSMPKSGGWLNSVKVVLGFVEVALAFKFLSNADLVGEWDLLRIEPFLLIWMLCSLGIALYLFGIISFPLDSKKRKTGPVGMAIAIAGVAFTAYLAFGLTPDGDTGTYRNRNLLSGIAPPVCYNFFLPCDEARNITPFKSLDEGLAYAREVGKPVMLDFTGYTCVNCRKMEENVWTVDKVDRYLKEDYVIVSLYVDDRTELPADEHREVIRQDGSGRTKLIDQVGEKWHYFEQTVYAKSSQPYYVLVHPDGTTLNPPVAYTPDADEYAEFLECGLETFRRLESK